MKNLEKIKYLCLIKLRYLVPLWNVCLVWVPNLYNLSEPNNSSNEKEIKQYWECKTWENKQIKSGRNEEEWGLQNNYRRGKVQENAHSKGRGGGNLKPWVGYNKG